MKFFHYLFESCPGEGVAQRVNEKTVNLALHDFACGEHRYDLPVDYREERVLVVIDGDLLRDSIPKAGDVVFSELIGVLETNVAHLRQPRFGPSPYSIIERDGKQVAALPVYRNFLLLPSGNFVFCRVRNKRSLGPMYVFGEVRKSASGPSVVWHNSTY